MNTLQLLTIRRNTALAKLSTLHRRAERLPGTASATVAAALAELAAALEHLQVATEQLEQQAGEIADARREFKAVCDRLDEFAAILPVPCVWTDRDGTITLANPAAADCLNVSASRLVGRPLLLFLADRTQFADALRTLTDDVSDSVSVRATLRPRERRPRPVQLFGRRLTHDDRRCWFVLND